MFPIEGLDEIQTADGGWKFCVLGSEQDDELEIMDFVPKDRIDPGTITSDEESEMPGTRRPKKGEGWWGHGHTMLSLRKGIPKPFCDGAGLCSPGRWPIQRRRLPNKDIAIELQQITEATRGIYC